MRDVPEEERPLRLKILKHFRSLGFKLNNSFLESDCYWSGYDFVYFVKPVNEKFHEGILYRIHVVFGYGPNKPRIVGKIYFERNNNLYEISRVVPLEDYQNIVAYLDGASE
jgi:hypothetical protein